MSRSAWTTTTATTGRSGGTCPSPPCTRTATTSTSWSSTCSCWPAASPSSSRSTTIRRACWPDRNGSSPNTYVIVEGLFPLHSKLARACFDVTVFLDPPEDVRRGWKLQRDTTARGYSPEQVLAELDRRVPESRGERPPAAQSRRHRRAVRPHRGAGRPARHPALGRARPAAHDPPSRPDRGARTWATAPCTSSCAGTRTAARWTRSTCTATSPPRTAARSRRRSGPCSTSHGPVPESLGVLGTGVRSEPLAVTQLLLLYHMLDAA